MRTTCRLLPRFRRCLSIRVFIHHPLRYRLAEVVHIGIGPDPLDDRPIPRLDRHRTSDHAPVRLAGSMPDAPTETQLSPGRNRLPPSLAHSLPVVRVHRIPPSPTRILLEALPPLPLPVPLRRREGPVG